VDKRRVRRDHADFFCTTSEGVRGGRALEWRLVDELAPRSRFAEVVAERADALADLSDRPAAGEGVTLTPLAREFNESGVSYQHVSVKIDRELGAAFIEIRGPDGPPPGDPKGILSLGDRFWPLALARELDDAILHLRTNEGEVGTWVFRTKGDADLVQAYDDLLLATADHWLSREITLYLKRSLKRLDVSSRSLVTLVEPGSCFTGTLLELALAADRCYMLDGTLEDDEEPPTMRMTGMNFGPLPMVNGLTRADGRFLDSDELEEHIGRDLDAEAACELGLVTFIPDDIDWEDEVRLALEERASFSPDALTGMEANLRFSGPETLESKIFGRLSAWQNWIFQRPNASGSQGALQAYGTGARAEFDRRRA
jgi:benzoyl-CoA-dihydrodiol lyase